MANACGRCTDEDEDGSGALYTGREVDVQIHGGCALVMTMMAGGAPDSRTPVELTAMWRCTQLRKMLALGDGRSGGSVLKGRGSDRQSRGG